MEHAHLDEIDIAGRYVTGRLSTEERAEFEAHFVDCPECLDRIEAAEGLRSGFSVLAPGEQQGPSTFRFARRSRRLVLPLALAASIVLLLAVPIGMTVRAANRANRALQAERAAAAHLQEKLGDAQAALRQERDTRSKLGEQLARERRPQLKVPVFALIGTRGGEEETLKLPSVPQRIDLLLERETPPRYERYRVTLLSSDGKSRLQEEFLPTSREQLALGLHSSLLPPGRYVFQLDGITPTGSLKLVARHPVRVIIAPANAIPARR